MIRFHSLLCWFNDLAFLAGQGRIDNLGRRFRREGSSVDPTDLLYVLLTFSAIGLAIWLLSRYMAARERRGINNQRALFRELCRAHELDRPARRLLWQLARWHGLVYPAEMFTDPRRFLVPDSAVAFAARQDEIVSLRERLFAQGSEADE